MRILTTGVLVMESHLDVVLWQCFRLSRIPNSCEEADRIRNDGDEDWFELTEEEMDYANNFSRFLNYLEGWTNAGNRFDETRRESLEATYCTLAGMYKVPAPRDTTTSGPRKGEPAVRRVVHRRGSRGK